MYLKDDTKVRLLPIINENNILIHIVNDLDEKNYEEAYENCINNISENYGIINIDNDSNLMIICSNNGYECDMVNITNSEVISPLNIKHLEFDALFNKTRSVTRSLNIEDKQFQKLKTSLLKRHCLKTYHDYKKLSLTQSR